MSQSVPELGGVLIRRLLYTGGTLTTAVKAVYENGIQAEGTALLAGAY
jgi:hypothetical protein